MCYRKALPQEKERAHQRLGSLSETISVILSTNNEHTIPIQDRGLPEAFITNDNQLMILRSNFKSTKTLTPNRIVARLRLTQA